MPRLFPLLKGGGIGVVFVLFLCPKAFSQLDSSRTSYRLKKTGLVSFNFGESIPAFGKRADFRIGKNGDFYFFFFDTGKLWHFDRSGKLVRAMAAGRSFLEQSSAITLNSDGDLFLFDSRQEKLYRYDASLDLIGTYSVNGGEQLDPVFGLAATSWGDLLATGGIKSGLWSLEPEGRGLSARPVYAPEMYRYSYLTEIGGWKLLAADPAGDLIILDRYGNLLRTFHFGKGLRVAAVGPNFLATVGPCTDVRLLDSVGTLLAGWKAAELDSTLQTAGSFQTAGNRIYFLLPDKDAVAVFQILRQDSILRPGGEAAHD